MLYTKFFSYTMLIYKRERQLLFLEKKKEEKKQQQNGNETTTQNQHTNTYNQANSPRSGNAPVLLLREE